MQRRPSRCPPRSWRSLRKVADGVAVMSKDASINSVMDRAAAEHYPWGQGCEGWHLLKRQDLSVIAERVPPGARETAHVHTFSRQFFYILSGRAVIEVDGCVHDVDEGQGLEIAPGQAHQFRNESETDVHFLVISQPSTRGDRRDC